MNIHVRAGGLNSATLAPGAPETVGAAVARDRREPRYGRRVEGDRSWTVHHVFTGAPAWIDGVATSGLSRLAATDLMLSLNRRSVRNERARHALALPQPHDRSLA